MNHTVEGIVHNHEICTTLTTAITSTKNANIVFAICDSSDQQRDRHIKQYESSLGFAIRPYRIEIEKEEPSILCNLTNLIKNNTHLQRKGRAVITVTGTGNLSRSKQINTDESSEVEVFIEGLQWIENHMKKTPYSMVVWISQEVYEITRFGAFKHWDSKNRLFRFVNEEK